MQPPLQVQVDDFVKLLLCIGGQRFAKINCVRQIEVGMASLFSLVFGLTAAVFGVILLLGGHRWLGWWAIVGAVGVVGAAVAQAFTGFSELAMNMSMPASVVLLLWIVAVGLRMWRQEAA